MKVIFFNGSPRGQESNTHRIAEPLLAGATAAGADVEDVFLMEKNIEHCLGCFHCWTKTPGKCCINDDMEELMGLFLESDIAGMGTPVYGLFMTGLLKNFLDRMLPLATPHIQKGNDGGFYHNGRIQRYPQQFFIANSGFPGDHNFDLLNTLLQHQPQLLKVYRNCGEALPRPTEAIRPAVNRFYAALYTAGEQMVLEGKVSEEIQRSIQAPIMSDEAYMEMANQHWDEELGES